MAGEREVVNAVLWAIGIQLKAIFYVIRVFFRLFLFWHYSRPAKPQHLTLSPDARFEHTHIVAGSGHGKKQLIQHMIETQDLERVRARTASVIVIDSQGDLIQRISRLREFSPDQFDGISDRVILMDPNDIEHPPCLNLFDFGLERTKKYTPVQQNRF